MKVLLRFNEAYDKYLFEGVIDPKDLFKSEASCGGAVSPGGPLFTGVVSPPSMNEELSERLGSVASNDFVAGDYVSKVNIYVLNTLDSSDHLGSEESSGLFTFFNSITEPLKKVPSSHEDRIKDFSLKETYILLLAPQNPEIFNSVVEKFYNKVSGTEGFNGSVIVYNTSCLVWKQYLKNLSSSNSDSRPELERFSKSFPKHFQIDMSLTLSTIELFNRKHLNSIDSNNNNSLILPCDLPISIPKKLQHLKGLKIFKPGFSGRKFSNSSNDDVVELSRLYNFFTSDHHEDYRKRLIPLIPFVNYRINDSLETFHLKLVPLYKGSKPQTTLVIKLEKLKVNFLVSEIEKFTKLNNSLLISNLFSIPWTHIYLNIEDSTELEKLKPSVPETPMEKSSLEFLYNFISEIYAQKHFKTFIKNLKRNPDYSLLWEDDDIDFSESYKQKTIEFLEENPPALILKSSEEACESESFQENSENFYVL